MNKFKLAIVLFFVGNIAFAMEDDNNNNNNNKRRAEDSLESVSKKQRTESNEGFQDVILISKQGHKFSLPRSCAEKAPMVKQLLASGMKEAAKKEIFLPKIDTESLSFIVSLLTSDEAGRKKILQDRIKSMQIDKAALLQDAADFLNCTNQLEVNYGLPCIKDICNAVTNISFESAKKIAITSKIGIGHTMPITALAIVGDKIVTGSADKTIKIWDVNGTCLRTLQGHSYSIEQLEFLDNNKVMSLSRECSYIWDINNGKILSSSKSFHQWEDTSDSDDDDDGDDYIKHKLFTTKNKIFNLSLEKMVAVHKNKSGAQFQQLFIDGPTYHCVGAWADCRDMKDPIVLNDDYIFAVDIKNRHQINKIKISDVMDEGVFCTSSDSTLFKTSKTKNNKITALALVEDKLISGHVGGYITIWEASSGIVIKKIDCNKLDCTAKGIHSLLPVDKKLIIGSANAQAIHICNLETDEVSALVLPGYDGSQRLGVYTTGDKLFYLAKDGTLNMLNGRTCCKTNITGVMNENPQIAIMGNKIITAQADHTIKIWDVSSYLAFDKDPVAEFEQFMKQQLPLVYAIFFHRLADIQNTARWEDQEIFEHFLDTVKSNFGDQMSAIVRDHLLQVIEEKYGKNQKEEADLELFFERETN